MIRIIKTSGLVFALIAIVLSATKFYSFSLVPGLIAIVFSTILWFMGKRSGDNSKYMQYIGLLVVMTIALSAYNHLFNTPSHIPPQELPNFERMETDSIQVD